MLSNALLRWAIVLLVEALAAPAAFAFPLTTGDLLATDEVLGQLIRIDPSTGSTTTISGEDIRGEGPSIDFPTGVLVTPDQRIYVVGRGANPVIEVDPASGDRVALVGRDAGDSRDCCDIFGLATNDDRYLVTVDRTFDRLRRIDTLDGSHHLFGPYLGRDHAPTSLVPAVRSGWYLASDAPDQLRRIDESASLNNPLIELIADSGYAGPGVTMWDPASIAVSAAETLYATTEGNALYGILAFDLASGERRLVSGSNRLVFDGWENPYERGNGPPLTSTSEIVVGLDGFIYAATSTGILRIDAATGNREIVVSRQRLAGLAVVPIPEPSSMRLHAAALIALTLTTTRLTRSRL